MTLRLDQEAHLQQLYQTACRMGLELLIEIIPPTRDKDDDQVLARSLRRLYNLGIRPDWWKLPSMNDAAWQAVSNVIDTQDKHCRGVVLLGLDAPMADMKKGFAAAARHGQCKGFTVGRTLFAASSRDWLAGEIDDRELIDRVAANYAELIEEWQRLRENQFIAEEASS